MSTDFQNPRASARGAVNRKRVKPRGSARGLSEQARTACLVVNCLLLRQQFQILLLPLGSWNRAQKFPVIRRPAWESER